MAVRSLQGAHPGARGTVLSKVRSAAGGIGVGVALPTLFLHVDHQPGFTLHAGSVGVHIALSDLFVAALAGAALAVGLRAGFGPLRAGVPVWIAAGGLLLVIGAATLYGKAIHEEYRLGTHAVTAAKFAFYALIALAVPLLVRRRRELEVVFAALVAWSTVATAVGLLQFFGVDIAGAWSPGRRQPSFLGHHDFAALSGASLGLALATLVLGPRFHLPRRLGTLAGAAGVIGLVLSGSSAGVVGLAVAAVAAMSAGRRLGTLSIRRAVAAAGIVVVVGGGVLALRGQDFDQFLRWAGVRDEQQTTREDVQTYAQHTLLAYLGFRIFLDHPVLGVGWQGSAEYASYRPYLGDAHRRFPDTAERAFPAPGRPYGVQNVYVQALADMGLLGFIAFAGLLVTGLVLSARLALRSAGTEAGYALAAGLALIVAMGVWAANGLVAGIPIDALLWLVLGLLVAMSSLAHARD